MSQDRIRRAFETKLKAWAASASLPVAFENATFAPPPGPYLRAWLLPNTTYSDTLDRLHRRYMGFFQVSVVMPAGRGAGAAELIVKALANEFDPAGPLEIDGLAIWLTQPLSASPGVPDADRYTVPCSVPYRADT